MFADAAQVAAMVGARIRPIVHATRFGRLII